MVKDRGGLWKSVYLIKAENGAGRAMPPISDTAGGKAGRAQECLRNLRDPADDS